MNTWIGVVAEKMPHLSKPQALVLALWSFGVVVSGSCGLTSVTRAISDLTEQAEDNVRQRLRDWNRDVADKPGKKRKELNVSSCFVDLLGWILSWWQPKEEKRLVLAMDATTLGQRYVVLAISVVYRACAIPIAWHVYPYADQSDWKSTWLGLFDCFPGVVPPDWTVLVLADRGLYANWLFTKIQQIGWHPFLRINRDAHYRHPGESAFRPVRQLANQPGCTWAGVVMCFKSNPLACTLLVHWAAGYEDAWIIVTDLPYDHAKIAWYGLRAWIECGFRQTKRAGWQWHQTRMTDPHRAMRHWLAISVATLWVVSVGGELDAARDPQTPSADKSSLPKVHPSQPRLLSCFRQGILKIRTELIKHKLPLSLPLGHFFPNYSLFDAKPTL